MSEIKIENYIFEVRGKKVICDFDLARIYGVETKRINEAVKNNPRKFPSKYSFKMTEKESKIFLVENFDQKMERRGGKYKNPRVFTEEGCLMLGTILKSDVAINTTILVIEAFVAMKKFISYNLLEQRFINNIVLEHDSDIKLLKETFSKFDNISNEIFFEGQIYDAYSLFLDILDSSKESIIVIDNFANKKLFDLLSKTMKEVTVYSKNIDEEVINKYKKQYNNVRIKQNNSFHDRYMILDKKVLYHLGASFKDLGMKCFSINKINNVDMINDILGRL